MLLGRGLNIPLLVVDFFTTVCALRFIAIGDWGVTLPGKETVAMRRQAEVAWAMNKWVAENGPLDFVLTTGDNFYPRGVLSNDSSRFKVTWKDVYGLDRLRGVPWYVTLGNHDYQAGGADQRELNQVAHGLLDPLWTCPYLWHSTTWSAGRNTLQVVVIDSMALKLNKHNPRQQLSWLKAQLAKSEADWLIFVSHHPFYSVGLNGPSDRFLVEQVLPLIQKYGVDVALSGHDHALEHIKRRDGGGPDFVISGAGGKEPYTETRRFTDELLDLGLRVRFYKNDNGFVTFTARNNKLHVEFYDRKCNLLHNFTQWKANGYREMHSLNLQ